MVISDLTLPVLQRLYIEEQLTELEIARLYGTYQVKVNRLRKKYGIPTITKFVRFNLPEEFTIRQKSLLIGSMLGDGRLFPSGSGTAAYSEHHSEAQREYLDWKAAQWGPFVCSIRPARKVTDIKTYRGSILRLFGSTVFRTYWRIFYPDGCGNKTFIKLPLDLVDGFAIAVWFMDDGSRASRRYLRFSVGPRPLDQTILLRVLAKFNIMGKIYSSGGNHELLIGNRPNVKKLSALISAHIPPCMRYKLNICC